MGNEAQKRLKIDQLLLKAGWDIETNIKVEVSLKKSDGSNGSADYGLLDTNGRYIAILEAKSEDKDPLVGKEQAREYSRALGNKFVILSNGDIHYLWDLDGGNPKRIYEMPSQEELMGYKKFEPNKSLLYKTEVTNDFIARSQMPEYDKAPEYIDQSTRQEFLYKNKLVILRDYQVNAIKSIQNSVKEGNERFLFEMATGTGKTKTSAGLIKLFLQTENAKRVLFLVDRIELEEQAHKAFRDTLKPNYTSSIWKEHRDDWRAAHIVVSTVQSFTKKNKYKRIFQPSDFDLVISDEAHRSIGGNARKVFEYFNGYKLGLTATPKDYLKGVDEEKLNSKDPRELEKRLLKDTYSIFGCESGEPTFRYSLLDGVKDGYLINPIVLDARTEITTQLISDEGYFISSQDEDGNDVEESFGTRDFEKKFFSELTNQVFAKTFLENALKDPITNEIGKSLIFCVSQKHASKITQILNEMASKLYPGVYQSDFAVQITSSIANAQQYTVNFTNNNLNGESDTNPYYKSSKTRVCVTCSMMTTGYDCEDLLNVVLMKPVFSPSDFVQMKGRGTRKHNFLNNWINKKNLPELAEPNKTKFYLFDFFGNCEYFEEKYNYDQKLKLPSISKSKKGDGGIRDFDEFENELLDPLKTLKTQEIGVQGMKIDREGFNRFRDSILDDEKIIELHSKQDLKGLEDYLVKDIFDKPSDYFNLEKLAKSLGIDRRISIKELIDYTFGVIPFIKSRSELLDEEFEKFDDRYMPEEEYFNYIKDFFYSYIQDKELREIIDSKQFSKLNFHPAGESFKNIPVEYRNIIPNYVNNYVTFNPFAA